MIRRRALLGLAGTGVLTGCGWRPVYMAQDGKAGPSTDLEAIEVKPMYERPGQILRETLRARLQSDTGAAKKYDLQVAFWVAGEGLGVLSFTQFTRVRLTGTAVWTLTSRTPGSPKLTEGSDRILDGFDIYDAQFFASDMQNEALQRRLAEHMADRIALRLAMWFEQHPTAKG